MINHLRLNLWGVVRECSQPKKFDENDFSKKKSIDLDTDTPTLWVRRAERERRGDRVTFTKAPGHSPFRNWPPAAFLGLYKLCI